MQFDFGDFQLDSAARDLRRAGVPVSIEPKVFDLLAELLDQRGRVVSREALERALWPDVRVSPAALSRLVKEARRALGDDGHVQTWIETVRGRGFRFAARARVRGCSPADVPYVGREALVRRLDAVLERALRGQGALLLISGEPGVGKTRTAEELVARARLLGVQVATAWSPEAAEVPALWTWARLLVALAENDAAASARLGPSADILTRLVPELDGAEPGSTPPIDVAADRFRLFDGVRGFLSRSTRSSPAVLVLDDLHWSDPQSIELLDFLCHDLARTPVVMLATYREPELARDARRSDLLARLGARPEVEHWPLGAFTKNEVRAFVETCTSRAPTRELVDLLSARSDGSPLFLRELLHVAALRGLLDSEPAAWDALAPSGLESFIEARVRSLTAGTRRVLSRAAAIGREFEDALLPRVGGLSEDALREALDEGVAVRVLVPAARPGWHRFSHALVRDALYAGLGSRERAEAHARVVAALERDAVDGEPEPEVMAHHCLAALPLLAAERAFEACARAGERALRIHSSEVAARYLGRALDLLDARRDESSRRRCALLLQLGEARRLQGDVPGAREAFAHAADLAHAQGDMADVAHAALGFAGLYAYGPPDAAVAERIESAAELLGPEHEALRARLLARLASELMLDPDRGRRAALRRCAWIAAGNGSDVAALVEIAAHPDHGIWDTMVPPRERRVLAASYVAQCSERGLGLSELAARVMLLDELLRLGRTDEYDAHAPGVDRLASQIREPRLLWVRLLQGFSRAQIRGDFDAAERCAARAREFGERHLDSRAALALWARQFAILRAAQDRAHELREAWERAGAGAGTPSNRALHAWICAAAGDLERAREIATPIWAEGATALVDEPMASANAAVLAEVCVHLKEPGPADVLLGLLRPYAGMNALRTYAACHGPVDYFRGLLESLRGRPGAAELHQRGALALARRMESPTFSARSHAALAALRAA